MSTKTNRTCATCAEEFKYPSELKRHLAKKSSSCFVNPEAGETAVEGSATPKPRKSKATTPAMAEAEATIKPPKSRSKKPKGLTDEERTKKQLEMKSLEVELLQDRLNATNLA
jgi:hypothetical protein